VSSPALALIDAVAARRSASPRLGVNIGTGERAASALVGAALLVLGARRLSLGGAAVGAAGGALLYRAVRGRSRLYEAVGMSTAAATGRVTRATTVSRPPDEVYAFCRDLEHLARCLPGARTVTSIDGGRLAVSSEMADGSVRTWEAVVVADTVGEILAWRGIGGPSGTLTFRRAPGDRGTEVRLALDDVPAAEITEALRDVKRTIETGEPGEPGEVSRTDRQPAARPD
jgi:uncharacterized membrane protein